jgi:hypothetical protein
MDLELFELCDDHGVKKWVKKHILGSGAGIQSAIVGYNFNICIWFHVISLNTILYFLLGVESFVFEWRMPSSLFVCGNLLEVQRLGPYPSPEAIVFRCEGFKGMQILIKYQISCW